MGPFNNYVTLRGEGDKALRIFEGREGPRQVMKSLLKRKKNRKKRKKNAKKRVKTSKRYVTGKGLGVKPFFMRRNIG